MKNKLSKWWFLRRVIILAMLPAYGFFMLNIKALKGLFNCWLRPLLFKYIVQRIDIFYFRIFIILAILYFNMITYKPFSIFDRHFGPRIPGYGDFSLYFQLVWHYVMEWFTNVSFLAAPVALVDEFLVKPWYFSYRIKPQEERKRLEYRNHALANNVVYMGTDIKSGKPMYVTDKMRELHVHLVGTTGSGKTESIIFPMLFSDICRGRGAIVVDAKGDIKFYRKLYTYHMRHNPVQKKQEIYIVNLGDPNFSNTYNPLLRGNAIELKDRVMGSLIWSETFYKEAAEEVLLVIFQALESAGKKVTFLDLYILLTEKMAVQALYEMVPDEDIKRLLLKTVIADFKNVTATCKGIIIKLNILAHGGLAKISNTYMPDIDLMDVYLNNKIVYFTIPTNLLEETAQMFGRMLVMDLKSCVGSISMSGRKSHFFPVYIDEAAEFVTDSFVTYLNKARDAGVSILLAHQSNADFDKKRESIIDQITDNTNVKLCMRVNSPNTAEEFSNQVGTTPVGKETTRIDKGVLIEQVGEQGSIREAEEYKVHPNVLKELGQGQSLVYSKHPKVFHQIVYTDYYPNPESYEGMVLMHRVARPGEAEYGLNIRAKVQLVPLEQLGAKKQGKDGKKGKAKEDLMDTPKDLSGVISGQDIPGDGEACKIEI